MIAQTKQWRHRHLARHQKLFVAFNLRRKRRENKEFEGPTLAVPMRSPVLIVNKDVDESVWWIRPKETISRRITILPRM